MSLTNMCARIALLIAAGIVSTAGVLAAELPAALLDPYLRLEQALVADSTEGVGDAAAAIATAAASLGADGAPLAASAKKLSAAANLAEARTAFGDLSTALVAYATKVKADLPTGVRIAYCPMVNKPWLQKEQEIRNPYYGSKMLTCGSFKK